MASIDLSYTDPNSNVVSVTGVKPYTVMNTVRYAVKPVLYPTVVNIGIESKRIEFMVRTSDSNIINFFKNFNAPDGIITVSNSTIDDIPNGDYSMESIDLKHDAKNYKTVEIRVSMFYVG